MVHDLRRVVPVVDVLLFPDGQVFEQVAHAVLQPRVVAFPAEIHPAEQAFGGERERRAVADAVGVAAAVVAGDLVEELAHAAEGRAGDVEAGHAGALQGHHEPAGDGHVAVDAGLVAPAAFGRLDLDAVVDGLLGGVAILVVGGHAEQLAEGDGAHGLGVELLVGADLVEELAFLVHAAEELDSSRGGRRA